jgi:hypothetical protein
MTWIGFTEHLVLICLRQVRGISIELPPDWEFERKEPLTQRLFFRFGYYALYFHDFLEYYCSLLDNLATIK